MVRGRLAPHGGLLSPGTGPARLARGAGPSRRRGALPGGVVPALLPVKPRVRILDDRDGVEGFDALHKTPAGMELEGGRAYGHSFRYSLEHDYSTFVVSRDGREVLSLSRVHPAGRYNPETPVKDIRDGLDVLRRFAAP